MTRISRTTAPALILAATLAFSTPASNAAPLAPSVNLQGPTSLLTLAPLIQPTLAHLQESRAKPKQPKAKKGKLTPQQKKQFKARKKALKKDISAATRGIKLWTPALNRANKSISKADAALSVARGKQDAKRAKINANKASLAIAQTRLDALWQTAANNNPLGATIAATKDVNLLSGAERRTITELQTRVTKLTQKIQQRETLWNGAEAKLQAGPQARLNQAVARFENVQKRIETHSTNLETAKNGLVIRKNNKAAQRIANYDQALMRKQAKKSAKSGIDATGNAIIAAVAPGIRNAPQVQYSQLPSAPAATIQYGQLPPAPLQNFGAAQGALGPNFLNALTSAPPEAVPNP